MGNKAQNLLNSIKDNKDNCKESIILEATNNIFVGAEKATPAKQGKMIKSSLEILSHNQQNVSLIMRQCNCLSKAAISEARKCYEASNSDIPKFLELLNEKHIGGGQLHIGDNGNIIGIYSKCYCGIPKSTKDMPAGYCECSAGWFEKLFESVFQHKVDVKINHTILSGFPECIFEINYNYC